MLPGGGDERGKAADHAAPLLGAAPRYIQAAKHIDGMCPDLLPHVILGKINMIDAQQTANLSPGIRAGVLQKLSRAPPGLATDARRMIRDHAGVMPLGRFGHEYRVVLSDDQLGALDDGDEIAVTLADHPAVSASRRRPRRVRRAGMAYARWKLRASGRVSRCRYPAENGNGVRLTERSVSE